MRTRQRVILQVGLAVAAGLLAWRFGTEWKRADRRYAALARPSPGRTAVVPGPARRELPPTDEIVSKNLFTPERNNEIAPEPEKPAPPPPLVFGTMRWGDHYEALVAEGGAPAGRSPRRMKPGEQVGGYTVVEISDQTVVVEYGGKKTALDVYQSAHSVAPAAPARTAAPSGPVIESAGSPPSPAAKAGQPASAATSSAAGQPAPAPPGVRVTVEGNQKKFERDTPFGTQTWYEPVQP